MPGGPYSSPGTAVSAGGVGATAGPRPGQVRRVGSPTLQCVLIGR